jgi:hypothetical protein
VLLERLNWKIQWHWESKPRPSGLKHSATANCATVCLMLNINYKNAKALKH